MFTGVVVKQSLDKTSVLEDMAVLSTWIDGDWTLCKVFVDEDEIEVLSTSLADGPWYMHFWSENKDDIRVVFKDKVFNLKYSDKVTWNQAITHGTSLGIPAPQLDFKVDEGP
jgi:hypothetical protein